MDIEKIILVYLCMAIAVSMFFPQVVLNPDEQTSVLGLFDVSYNSTSKEVYMGSSQYFKDSTLNSELVQTDNNNTGIFQNIIDTGQQYYQSFIDGLKNVMGAVKIFTKFIFSPIIFVSSPDLLGDAPIYVKLIFALPLILMAFFGLVKFIRGWFG
jgi:hypothetical protein